MKLFLMGSRPIMLSEKEGLVEAWDWERGEMVAAPELMPTAMLGVGPDGEPADIEEVSPEKFKAAVLEAKNASR